MRTRPVGVVEGIDVEPSRSVLFDRRGIGQARMGGQLTSGRRADERSGLDLGLQIEVGDRRTLQHLTCIGGGDL